jgi:hypothetical protein
MGTLRSVTDHTGMQMYGITLGDPVRNTGENDKPLPGSEYRWDDSRLPNGVIEDDGTITLDETDDV